LFSRPITPAQFAVAGTECSVRMGSVLGCGVDPIGVKN
jgi:hypothetical protein